MNRPNLSLLNVLTGTERAYYIRENPLDPPVVSELLAALMIEYVHCYRFINWPIPATAEQNVQRRELHEYNADLRKDIIRLCGSKETRAVLDIDDEFACIVHVHYVEDSEFKESSEWHIDVDFARKLKGGEG